MRFAILGAGGRLGHELIKAAHAGEHSIKALVRADLHDAPESVGTVKGDVFDDQALDAVVAGTDAILSALGPHGVGATALYSRSVGSILAAMLRTGVRRLVCTSCVGVEDDPGVEGLAAVFVFRTVFRRAVLDDMRAMEKILGRSLFDWTVVRPAPFTDGRRLDEYRVQERFVPSGGTRISRADVAAFMLLCATDGLHVREHPAIAY